MASDVSYDGKLSLESDLACNKLLDYPHSKDAPCSSLGFTVEKFTWKGDRPLQKISWERSLLYLSDQRTSTIRAALPRHFSMLCADGRQLAVL